jgi:hypothetical protein
MFSTARIAVNPMRRCLGERQDLVNKTWLDDVRDALLALGGEAHISDIYESVLQARQTRGDTFNNYRTAVAIRLQQNAYHRGRHLFEHGGSSRSGRWKLSDPVWVIWER